MSSLNRPYSLLDSIRWVHLRNSYRMLGTRQYRTFDLTGDGRCLFFTSIQGSESRSGKLVDNPLDIDWRFVSSLFLVFRFPTFGELGADSKMENYFYSYNIMVHFSALFNFVKMLNEIPQTYECKYRHNIIISVFIQRCGLFWLNMIQAGQ